MINNTDFTIKEVAGYRLTERIGSGGMGEVYKAYNSSLNRFAAVKVLYQKDYAERFKHEAYIQSSVSHPNIAHLYEYVAFGDKPGIIMEYVEGESLDSLLRRKGKVSIEETENIIRQIAAALAYLHKKDIMHRDIKPQNFKIQADGTVKMLDFGIAKHKYSPKLTQSGFVVGTLEYLAPEQFQQQAELKSDTWALAVMTYELVTGYMPFEASNPATLRAIITKGIFTNPQILVPDISLKLSTIIDKGLRINPASRIAAASIEDMFKHKKALEHLHAYKMFWVPFKKLLLPGLAAIALILFFIFYSKSNLPGTKIIPVDNNKSEMHEGKKIKITALGIDQAELIFPDGSRKQLPHEVEGKEGDMFEFIIHADGYIDKKVEVVITPHRSSYEYNLSKINN